MNAEMGKRMAEKANTWITVGKDERRDGEENG